MDLKKIENLFHRQAADVGGKKNPTPLTKMGEVFLIIFSVGLLFLNLSQVVFFSDPRISRLQEEKESFNGDKSENMFDWQTQPVFNAYADFFSNRDIFKGISSNAENQAVFNQEVPVSVVTMDLSTNYRLAGIVLDKKPQAVIEDIAKQETLFLSVGDRLGEGVVEEILRDRVVVRINSQRQELLQKDAGPTP